MNYDLCVDQNDPLLVRGWDIENTTLSPHLFAIFTDICNGGQVNGLLTSINVGIGSEWDSKMSQDNIDDKVSWSSILQTGGLGQVVDADIIKAFKGRTHFTKDQTRQIWTGTSPVDINIEVAFVAITNPLQEVASAIALLQRMTSPTIKDSLVDSYKDVLNATINGIRDGKAPQPSELNNILGFIPSEITISVLDELFDAKYILMSVDYSDGDILRNKDGVMMAANVSLQFKSTTSLNKADIYVH